MNSYIDGLINFFKSLFAFFSTLYISYLFPIEKFFIVIIVLATVNVGFGAVSDREFHFNKAFHAILYLIGYFGLLGLIMFTGKNMNLEESQLIASTGWVTWMLIWFYSSNILRNWTICQSNNRPIAFLYWVVSFKLIEKIKFLKEWNANKKNNE